MCLQGGMKAVIWTDVIQTIMMFVGVILSIVFGRLQFIYQTLVNFALRRFV